jgi:hypothetical protein
LTIRDPLAQILSPLLSETQSKDKVKLYKLLPIPPEEGAKPDPSAVVKKDWVEQGHGVIKILEKIQPGRAFSYDILWFNVPI